MFCSRNSKKRLARDHPVLDHLGQSAAELALGKRLEHLGIDPDADRLVKGADHVLGAGMIDADLAPDRAVDLRQERGWHHESGSPRVKVAATNPARSPTTPPPSATTSVCRSAPRAASSSYSTSTCASDLDRFARGHDGRPGRHARGFQGGLEPRGNRQGVEMAIGHDHRIPARRTGPRPLESPPHERAEPAAVPPLCTSIGYERGPSSTVTRSSGEALPGSNTAVACHAALVHA